MCIHFQRLFALEAVHDYYGGERSADLDFVVAEREPALAAGRLLARMHDGRLLLLAETDGAGRALGTLSGQTLWIGLRLNNPAFVHFTQPPVAAGLLPFYANSAAADAFDAPLGARLLAARQRIAPASAVRPLQLRWQRVSRGNAATVAERTLQAGDRDATFLTGDWPSGHYRLQEGAAPEASHWLRLPRLGDEPLWGVAAVNLDDAFHAAAPGLRIALAARRETLEYYVVADNFGAGEFAQLELSDAGAAEQQRDPIDFERIAAADFSTLGGLPASALHSDPARVLLFRSRTPVARRAGGYRKLQLKRNSEVLVQHLPQAASGQARARFVVHLAKS